MGRALPRDKRKAVHIQGRSQGGVARGEAHLQTKAQLNFHGVKLIYVILLNV